MHNGARLATAAIVVARPGDDVLVGGSLIPALGLAGVAVRVAMLATSDGSAAIDNPAGVAPREVVHTGHALTAHLQAVCPALVVLTDADRLLEPALGGCRPMVPIYRWCLPERVAECDSGLAAALAIAVCPDAEVSAVLDTRQLRPRRERAISSLGAPAEAFLRLNATARQHVLSTDHLQRLRPPHGPGDRLLTSIPDLIPDRPDLIQDRKEARHDHQPS